jgi:hypothetical protein
VSQGSSEWFWKTMARSGPGSSTGLFSRKTSPVVDFSKPPRMLSKVDLPQPEWPISDTNSPWAMARLTSRSTSLDIWPRLKLMPICSNFK